MTLLTPEGRHDRCVVAIATGSSCEFTLAVTLLRPWSAGLAGT